MSYNTEKTLSSAVDALNLHKRLWFSLLHNFYFTEHNKNMFFVDLRVSSEPENVCNKEWQI